MTEEKLAKITQNDIKEVATLALQSGLLPSGTTPPQVMAMIHIGREIGLQPFQAVKCMAFIKGRLTMAVQLQLSLARQRAGVKIKELLSTDTNCKITLSRDDETITCEYSIEDAIRAGLLKETEPCRYADCKCKNNPDYHKSGWQKYPRQYLRWRAIGDALRLIAPDIIMGLISPEEAETLEEIQLVPSELIGKPIVEMPKEIEAPKPTPDAKPISQKPPEKTKPIVCISTAQVKIIQELAKKKGLDIKLVAHEAGIDDISELPASEMKSIVKWLNDQKYDYINAK